MVTASYRYAIDVDDGRIDEFSDIYIVEASDIDTVDRAARLWDISSSERAHAAVLAEQMVVMGLASCSSLGVPHAV